MIVFYTGIYKDTLRVIQSCNQVLDVSPHFSKIGQEGGDLFFTVTSNTEYSISSTNDNSWLNVEWISDSVSFERTLHISVAPLSIVDGRECKIRFQSESLSTTLSICQKRSDSVDILVLGNSFSSDALEYLYPILSELGYHSVYIGNLMISGCSIETHVENIENGLSVYQYYTNSSGVWCSRNNYSANLALRERDWDFVSTQQVSGLSGILESYDPYLSNLLGKIKEYAPRSQTMWHMTWAYQGNSRHKDFVFYDNSQLKMYGAIVDAVKIKILNSGFDMIIPSGTAVQNLRSSFIGDTITRDGYHLSYGIGRFIAALMWARQITGKSIMGIDYLPPGYSISEEQTKAIKEAVEVAFRKPLAVTKSSFGYTTDN